MSATPIAYDPPSWFQTKVLNRLATRFGGQPTLEVTGRRSGQPHHTPVNLLEHDGQRYVVSIMGDAEWVRNLRAAGIATVHDGDAAERVSAAEVPVAERQPLIDAYLRTWPRKAVQACFERLPDPADHPVFRLDAV